MAAEDDKVFERELELLKKMSPEKLKAQAQMELSMMDKENPYQEVEYYPNQGYIDKKQKGEKIPMQSIYALAAAQKRGEQTGVLKPEVAKYLLANALVEGRPDDFGVNVNAYPGSNKQVKEIITKMGLDDKTKPRPMPESMKQFVKMHGGSVTAFKDDDIVIKPYSGQHKLNAQYAVTMMAIKALQTGGNPEETIKAWNGKGPATELHLAKVKEAHRMLQDPKNAAVLRAYQRALQYADE